MHFPSHIIENFLLHKLCIDLCYKYDKENIVEKSIKDLGDFMKTTEGIEYFSLEAANKAS